MQIQNKWTEERFNVLCAMAENGSSIKDIAIALNLSKNAVIGKMHRHAIKIRKKEQQQEETQNSIIYNYETTILRAVVNSFDKRNIHLSGPTENPSLYALRDLKNNHCRWPIGDPLVKGFSFCKKDKIENQSYCLDHCKMSFRSWGLS